MTIPVLACSAITCLAFLAGGYQSFKLLKSNGSATHMLKYMCILVCLSPFEAYLEIFISWFPFYYVFKFILLFLIANPQTQFSTYLFDALMVPLLTKQQKVTEAVVLPEIHNALSRYGRVLEMSFLNSLLDGMPSAKLAFVEGQLKSRLKRIQEERSTRQACGKD
jgi:hypothetical protein